MRLQDDVMAQVGRFRSRGIIVDVTALDVMDSFVSRSLRGIAHMTRLRGAETVIVGIQPEVAFAMVQLGMNFEDVHTALDLEEGLAFLQQQLDGESGRRWRMTSGWRSARTRTSSPPARRPARMGAELGFSSTDLTLLATAISEVARNITTYAGEGEVALRVRARARAATGIEVVASDDGPGDRRRRARDAGRLHDRQRPRARAARHAPAGRRVRAADRAGRAARPSGS